MDLATRILQWKERPLSRWVSDGNRYLPGGASAVLLVGIAYQLAKLTWAVVPGPSPEAIAGDIVVPSGAAAASASAFDVSPIVNAHLFGEASGEPTLLAETPVDAPDTTLSLLLRGIVSSDDNQSGWAIIAANRTAEKTYFVKESIDNTNGALLHAVYEDRVILNRGGRLETLRLPKEPSATSPRAAAPLPVAQPTDEGASLRDVISENASRLSDVLRVAPFIDQGQMIGFRVTPAQNQAAFESLGLQANDIVTDINGTPLTDPGSGLQVFQALGEATMANVTVVRDGQPEVLVIDTSSLQQLAEDRQ
ncbi:MAG TPA: type II secretion system protein GspC [Gammaproteobacteria bacterium]|jgi:general secretion pathway protein C